MNVYDFDKTIYDGDSSLDFYLYALRKHPAILMSIPEQIYGLFLYSVKLISFSKAKSYIFSFLSEIDDVDKLVEGFWKQNEKKIKTWYLETKTDTDVIISASPHFLLAPISRKLGIERLLATEMNKANGHVFGENCKGEEKVKRFRAVYEEAKIEKFFSDSKSDNPLAKISEEAYLVKGNIITSWPFA